MTREELKAQLLKEAEAIINEIVGKDGNNQAETMKAIEEAALKAGEQVKASVLAGLVGNIQEQEEKEGCPRCGGQLRKKGKRSKWVLTQAGEVQVEREYYYCGRCKAGFFPPG
jgi:uncharacterized protein with PIN domain